MHFAFVAFRFELRGTAGSPPFGESNRVGTSLLLTPWREVFWRITLRPGVIQGSARFADFGSYLTRNPEVRGSNPLSSGLGAEATPGLRAVCISARPSRQLQFFTTSKTPTHHARASPLVCRIH